MTSRGDQLVEEYLRRFDNASVFLSDERRAELRQEIVEHIEAGTEEAQAVHADAVRAVLDRLGPPADIVASETDSGSFPEFSPALAKEPPSPHGTAHDGINNPPTDASAASAPVPSARPRRVSLPLIGVVVTAVVVAVVAFGVLGTSSQGDTTPQGPVPPLSESSEPAGEQPDQPSESGPETSDPPSQDATSPEETPSESPSAD